MQLEAGVELRKRCFQRKSIRRPARHGTRGSPRLLSPAPFRLSMIRGARTRSRARTVSRGPTGALYLCPQVLSNDGIYERIGGSWRRKKSRCCPTCGTTGRGPSNATRKPERRVRTIESASRQPRTTATAANSAPEQSGRPPFATLKSAYSQGTLTGPRCTHKRGNWSALGGIVGRRRPGTRAMRCLHLLRQRGRGVRKPPSRGAWTPWA